MRLQKQISREGDLRGANGAEGRAQRGVSLHSQSASDTDDNRYSQTVCKYLRRGWGVPLPSKRTLASLVRMPMSAAIAGPLAKFMAAAGGARKHSRNDKALVGAWLCL